MGESIGKSRRRNPLLGAAVLKALMGRRTGDSRQQTSSLYQGVLRDLHLTDSEVEEFLLTHEAEVERAIRSHGRRGE